MTTPLNESSVLLAGKSGQEYLFTVWTRQTRFRAKPGVYAMARALGGERFNIIYIGESNDLSVRPLNRDKLACFDQHGADHIFALDEPDASRRAAIAADLVQAMGPVCNGR